MCQAEKTLPPICREGGPLKCDACFRGKNPSRVVGVEIEAQGGRMILTPHLRSAALLCPEAGLTGPCGVLRPRRSGLLADESKDWPGCRAAAEVQKRNSTIRCERCEPPCPGSIDRGASGAHGNRECNRNSTASKAAVALRRKWGYRIGKAGLQGSSRREHGSFTVQPRDQAPRTGAAFRAGMCPIRVFAE